MALIDEVKASQLPPLRVRIRIRRNAGVSQTRMAAELGVHRSTLVRWENGELEPRGSNAARYARLLDDLERAVQ